VACRDFGSQLTKRFLDFLARCIGRGANWAASSGGNFLAAMTMHSMSERTSVRMPCTSRFLLTVPPTTASPAALQRIAQRPQFASIVKNVQQRVEAVAHFRRAALRSASSSSRCQRDMSLRIRSH
jgi:hypothetical protein